MLDWQHLLKDIRAKIFEAKKTGTTLIDIRGLELLLDNLEDNYLIRDKYEILAKINAKSNFDLDEISKYEKAINAYAKYSKERMDQEKQYAQILISSVYIGFFGIWNLSNYYLEVYEKLASFSLLLISILSFILLEVTKVGFVGYGITIKSKALLKAKAEDEIEEKIKAVELAYHYERWYDIWVARFWPWSYAISVVTGLLAIAILMKAYIKTLI